MPRNSLIARQLESLLHLLDQHNHMVKGLTHKINIQVNIKAPRVTLHKLDMGLQIRAMDRLIPLLKAIHPIQLTDLLLQLLTITHLLHTLDLDILHLLASNPMRHHQAVQLVQDHPIL